MCADILVLGRGINHLDPLANHHFLCPHCDCHCESPISYWEVEGLLHLWLPPLSSSPVLCVCHWGIFHSLCW